MSKLSQLKLVQAKRPVQLPPIVQRRNKMCARIAEQLECARAKQAGKEYLPTQSHIVKDVETGERKTTQIPKRFKEWWFATSDGKLYLSIKYGAKEIELAKGKNAISIADGKDLIKTLETLKECVESGELDNAIEAVSGAVRNTPKK